MPSTLKRRNGGCTATILISRQNFNSKRILLYSGVYPSSICLAAAHFRRPSMASPSTPSTSSSPRSFHPGSMTNQSFVLQTEEAHDFSQQSHLHVELSEGIIHSSQMEEEARRVCVCELPKISSEYRHLLAAVKQQAQPKVTALAYGDPVCSAEERSEKPPNSTISHWRRVGQIEEEAFPCPQILTPNIPS